MYGSNGLKIIVSYFEGYFIVLVFFLYDVFMVNLNLNIGNNPNLFSIVCSTFTQPNKKNISKVFHSQTLEAYFMVFFHVGCTQLSGSSQVSKWSLLQALNYSMESLWLW